MKISGTVFKLIFISVISILLISNFSFSQKKEETMQQKYAGQVDIKDVIKDLFHSKSRLKDTINILGSPQTLSVSILPGISYNPANGVVFGVSASLSKFLGSTNDTKISAISAAVSVTTESQLKVSVQSIINTNKNDWSLQGDWRFWKYSQNTYGLGTQTVPSDAQQMEFNFIRFNENVLKKLIPNCYIGLGYSFEEYSDITTLDSSDVFLYPNYNNTYSAQRGYDSLKYFSSGFVINLDYDSRDNPINPYKGIYADVKYYNYKKFFGSSLDWENLQYEFRAFKSITKDHSYIMAFWTLGIIGINNYGPYMSLPAVGWDKYNTTGRGYIQGRFRGNDFVYAGFENRIRLTKNGLLGMVLFVNVESASNRSQNIKLLDFIEPAGGIGLRIKFDKYSRTNLCVDFGFGRYGSSGVFMNIGEFF